MNFLVKPVLFWYHVCLAEGAHALPPPAVPPGALFDGVLYHELHVPELHEPVLHGHTVHLRTDRGDQRGGGAGEHGVSADLGHAGGPGEGPATPAGGAGGGLGGGGVRVPAVHGLFAASAAGVPVCLLLHVAPAHGGFHHIKGTGPARAALRPPSAGGGHGLRAVGGGVRAAAGRPGPGADGAGLRRRAVPADGAVHAVAAEDRRGPVRGAADAVF